MEKDIKKLQHNQSEHKKEMKKCLDMLAESNARIVTLTTELATKNGMEEMSEENEPNQQINVTCVISTLGKVPCLKLI